MRIDLVNIVILAFANYTTCTYTDKTDLWSPTKTWHGCIWKF